MIFIDRSRRGGARHLDWKIRLFGVGALLALVGMGLEIPLLVGLAISVLLLGFILRFLPGGEGDGGETRGPESSNEDLDSDAPPPGEDSSPG
jgi:hypothetical protein